MDALLSFLEGLNASGTSYRLGHHRADAVTVYVSALPRERWEVEFFDDGAVDIERFQGTAEGVVSAEVNALLAELRATR